MIYSGYFPITVIQYRDFTWNSIYDAPRLGANQFSAYMVMRDSTLLSPVSMEYTFPTTKTKTVLVLWTIHCAFTVLHFHCKEKHTPCNCLTVHCPAWLFEVVNDTEFTLGGLVCFQPSMTPDPATGPYPSLILSSSQPEIIFLNEIKQGKTICELEMPIAFELSC